jgi:hypothetical protein
VFRHADISLLFEPNKLLGRSAVRNFIFEKEFQIWIPWKSFSSFELKIEKKWWKNLTKSLYFWGRKSDIKRGAKVWKRTLEQQRRKDSNLSSDWNGFIFFVDFTKRSFQVLKLISVCFSSHTKKALTPSHWSKVRKWNFRNVISKDNDVIMFAFAYKQESEIITMKWKKKKLFVFAFSDRRTDNFATNIWNFLLLLLPTLFSGGGNKIVTKQIMGRVNVITRIGFLHFYHPFTPKDIHSF